MSYGTLHTESGKVYLLDTNTQLHNTYYNLSEKVSEDEYIEIASFTDEKYTMFEDDKQEFNRLLGLGIQHAEAVFSIVKDKLCLSERV